MKAKIEYRVVWKREGLRRKTRRYVRFANAEYFMQLLTTHEPWKLISTYADLDPNDHICCSGHQCGCGGLTIRDHFAVAREGMPELEYVQVEQREVGGWLPQPDQKGVDSSGFVSSAKPASGANNPGSRTGPHTPARLRDRGFTGRRIGR